MDTLQEQEKKGRPKRRCEEETNCLGEGHNGMNSVGEDE